ncbi:MAG: 50S ribosomal protein L25 [Desulfatiglandales bacterium]
MAEIKLSARIRDAKGKEVAKKLRRDDQVPAIFYGPSMDTVKLVVDYPELQKIVTQTAGENVILALQIESDSGSDTRRVMLKELQVDPIKDTYLHVDFYEISMDKEITVDIPIHLVNTPKGVTEGGILQHVRRELTVSCLPDKLVEHLEVDVSELDIGDSVHIQDIGLPDGVNTSQDGHLTVATVVAPSVIAEKVEEIEEEIEEEGEEKVEEEITDTEKESEEGQKDR